MTEDQKLTRDIAEPSRNITFYVEEKWCMKISPLGFECNTVDFPDFTCNDFAKKVVEFICEGVYE